MKRLRFHMTVALMVVVVTAVSVVVKSQTLPAWPPVVAQPGQSQTFLVTHCVEFEVLERRGVFLLQPTDNSKQRVLRAMQITYTLLEPDADGHLRLHVKGQPIDPESGRPLLFRNWQGIYRVEPDEPVLEGGTLPGPEYADLVLPVWLYWGPEVDEATGSSEDIEPGATWPLASQIIRDVSMSAGQSGERLGRFVGWRTVDQHQVAHIEHHVHEATSRMTDEGFRLGTEEKMTGTIHLVAEEFPLDARWIHEAFLEVSVPASDEIELPGSIRRKVRTEVSMVRQAAPVAGVFNRMKPGEIVDSRVELGGWDLGDGSQAAVYVFEGSEREQIVIALESHEFDPYLLLLDQDWNVLAEARASGGDFDALLDHVLPYTGTYYAVVNTESPDQDGLFTLALQSLGRQVDEVALRQSLEQALQLVDEALGAAQWQDIVELLEAAATHTRLQLPLAIREAHLVSERPTSYGEYIVRASRVYRPNESIQVYLEPDNFHVRHDGERHEIYFTVDATLIDAVGDIVVTLPDVAVWNRLTLRPIRDVYITVPLWVPDLTDGEYVWRMTVHDAISGQSATTDLPIVISGPGGAILP